MSDADRILKAFDDHAKDDGVTAEALKKEISNVKSIHDNDQAARRDFENTVNHVLFGSSKLGEKGMKEQVTEVHSRIGTLVTQQADLLRALRGDPLTGEVGLIKKWEIQEEKMAPMLDAWKAMKWVFGITLAFAALLGSVTVIKKFFPNL